MWAHILNISVPQLPLLDNRDINTTCLMVCCEGEGYNVSKWLRTGPGTQETLNNY